MPEPNYYDILQVSPDAEPEVIEAAYKRLAFKYHPDRNSDTLAQRKMRLLNEAYEVLSDSQKRAAYAMRYKNEPDMRTHIDEAPVEPPGLESREPPSKSKTLIMSLAIVLALFLAALLIVVWMSQDQVQNLSEMVEFDVKVAEGRFGKKGTLGYSAGNPRNDRILVNGKESPNGLSMHPTSNTFACAKYKLGKTARTFVASVALNDSAGAPGAPPGVGKIPTKLTFQVLGDGKVLWSSKPVDVARKVQECRVDVTEVNVLELQVDCPGNYTNAQAVWLEPRVLRK